MRGSSRGRFVEIPEMQSAPRVCGDDPISLSASPVSLKVLPAYAGINPPSRTLQYRNARVLPAYAGMIPAHGVNDWTDNPCSPRMRGSSLGAHGRRDVRRSAPRVCGDYPGGENTLNPTEPVLPAYAGIDPIGIACGTPSGGVLPAYAGIILSRRRSTSAATACSPRMRGMISEASSSRTRPGRCSPRMRGSSSSKVSGLPMSKVLPAYAGITRAAALGRAVVRRAPRVCGDDPRWTLLFRQSRGCSPRMRG